jgi:hypothetical protein
MAALAVACACALPAAASAQCGPPKGVVVANAELANALYLFVGQAGDTPSSLIPGAIAFGSAAAHYPGKILTALREPPQCDARRAPAPRKRRASAARRR